MKTNSRHHFIVKVLVILFVLTMTLACVCACDLGGSDYNVEVEQSEAITLTVGDEVDFTQYFRITDANGNRIVVTEDMLDLSHADLSTPGSFRVTLTFDGVTVSATFVVRAEGTGGETPGGTTPGGTTPGGTGSDVQDPTELAAILAKYADRREWNFTVDVTALDDYYEPFNEIYEYDGYNISNLREDGNYLDYLHWEGYDEYEAIYTYYQDDGEGNYTEYDSASDAFGTYYNACYLIDLTEIGEYAFKLEGGKYVAVDPQSVGAAVIAEYYDENDELIPWTEFSLTVSDGWIRTITAVLDTDLDEQEYTFSEYGSTSVTLPDVGGTGGGTGGGGTVTPSGTMEQQTYNAATFDDSNLQEKYLSDNMSLGTPSTGDVKILVIPVQFKGSTYQVTQDKLAQLEKALCGTKEDTGWESVASYYEKSSYGKLHLTFDIQNVYTTKNNKSYYESKVDSDYQEPNGAEYILLEALEHYASTLNLADYDSDGDELIDAVYLIYAEPVVYTEPDEKLTAEEQQLADFYWAYTTWYLEDNTYDGVTPYAYFFAGFDFMNEKVAGSGNTSYPVLDGMKINAETFIHETGHLFGLDDYYDYYTGQGCNEGLGGADMMDHNIGDHGVYSKIMLGWMTPTVVNSTQTVTINSSATTLQDAAILVPLNFNNSYFCEYLLIDLYSNTGLNAMHTSKLYGGALYGVRIYHVSSSMSYDSQYGYSLDYNNSDTKYALIKLVEADGTKKFSDSDGKAQRDDLWTTGQSLLGVFPNYTRNDGKKVNFDIHIDTVSATSATVTVTFNS